MNKKQFNEINGYIQPSFQNAALAIPGVKINFNEFKIKCL